MKYCKDCKHFEETGGPYYYLCHRLTRQREDVVTGIHVCNVSCDEARADGKECGPDAKLFEEKTS